MERKLPTHEIEGTVFVVDVANSRLVQEGKPENTISFLDEMRYKQSHYLLSFNKQTKGAGIDIGESRENLVEVKVPQMKSLDPVGMAARYGLTVEEVQAKNDFELLVPQKLYQARKDGILPTLAIGEDRFIIDMRLGELRRYVGLFDGDALAGTNPIKLATLDVTDDGNFFQFYYDAQKKEEYKAFPSLLKLPDNVFLATIPNELGLDPIYVAKEWRGGDVEGFLMKYPPQEQIAARLLPAAESPLAELVRRNRLRLDNGDEGTDQRPRQRPR